MNYDVNHVPSADSRSGPLDYFKTEEVFFYPALADSSKVTPQEAYYNMGVHGLVAALRSDYCADDRDPSAMGVFNKANSDEAAQWVIENREGIVDAVMNHDHIRRKLAVLMKGPIVILNNFVTLQVFLQASWRIAFVF